MISGCLLATKMSPKSSCCRRNDLPYTILAGEAESLSQLVGMQLQYEWRLYRAARQINPDVMMSIGVSCSSTSRHLSAQRVSFSSITYRRHVELRQYAVRRCRLYPQRFESDYGEKHVRYPGYHELAYLHPDEFGPNLTPCSPHGVDPDDRFCVVRFKSRWNDIDHGEGGVLCCGRTAPTHLPSRRAWTGVHHQRVSASRLVRPSSAFRCRQMSSMTHCTTRTYIGDSADNGDSRRQFSARQRFDRIRSLREAMSNFRELQSEVRPLFSTSDEIERPTGRSGSGTPLEI